MVDHIEATVLVAEDSKGFAVVDKRVLIRTDKEIVQFIRSLIS